MAFDLNDPLIKIKITGSVCGFVATCMTLLRLWIRRGRYWWDDAWSFFSMLCLWVQIASEFMHVENPDDLSHTSLIAAYYLIASTFYTIIWSARLSILFSIIRLDPDAHIRRRLYFVAGLFMAALLFFLAQLLWTCQPDGDGWMGARSPQCVLGQTVAICQLVFDILADSLLLILPLRLIRNMPRKSISAPLRRRLYIIFSTSIVTTVVSLVHAAYIIKGGGTKEILAALVEDCMSLSVAGLPVVGLALMSKGAAGSNVTPRGGGRRAVTITTTGTQTRTGVREGVGRNVEDEAGDENYDEDAGPKFEFTRFRNRWTKPRNDEVQLTTTTARGHSRAASDGRLEVHREQGSGSASASGSGSTSRRTSKDKRSAQSGYGWGSGGGTKDMKSWVVRGGRGGRGANRTLTTTTMTMTMTMGSLSEGDFPVDGSTTDDSEDADRKDVGSLSHGMDRRGESESANEVSTRGREDVRTPPGVPASPPLPFPPPVHHRDESRHDTPPHSPRHNSSRDHTTNPSTASHTTFGIISSNARTPINQHPVEGYDLQWTPAHSLASDHHTDHDDMEEDGESGSRRQHYIWVGDAQGGDEGEEVLDEMYEELSGSGESRTTSWSMGRIRDLISGSGRGT